MQKNKNIVTVKEAAAILHISEFRVRQKAAAKIIPGKKIPGGREWLFNRDELEKFLP